MNVEFLENMRSWSSVPMYAIVYFGLGGLVYAQSGNPLAFAVSGYAIIALLVGHATFRTKSRYYIWADALETGANLQGLAAFVGIIVDPLQSLGVFILSFGFMIVYGHHRGVNVYVVASYIVTPFVYLYVHQVSGLKAMVAMFLGIAGTLIYLNSAAATGKKITAARQHGALQEAMLELAQRRESLGLLSANIAHELNNLLSIILYQIEDGLDLVDDKLVRAHFYKAIETVKQGGELNSRILSLSRNSQNNTEKIDISNAVTKAVEFSRGLLDRTIEIVCESADTDIFISGDILQLNQVLLNLLLNAQDALLARDNDGNRRINLRVWKHEIEFKNSPHSSKVMAAVEIKDNGIGMTEEVIAKIFDPFFTTNRVREGSGLGLSVVQGILRHNDGLIDVDSRPMVGTSFQVYWPMCQ